MGPYFNILRGKKIHVSLIFVLVFYCHELSQICYRGLKQHSFIILHFFRTESDMEWQHSLFSVSYDAKSKCWWGCDLLWRVWRRIYCQAHSGCTHSLELEEYIGKWVGETCSRRTHCYRLFNCHFIWQRWLIFNNYITGKYFIFPNLKFSFAASAHWKNFRISNNVGVWFCFS